MDMKRLMEALKDSTCLISKGESTRKRLSKIPSLLWGLITDQSDPDVEKLECIDCQFITVGVNRTQAEKHRNDFLKFLEEYPDPVRLADGPTYKHMASVVGDEMLALRVFGLGQTLGIWDVILPSQLGVDPVLVEEAADLGLIVTTGYQNLAMLPQIAVG